MRILGNFAAAALLVAAGPALAAGPNIAFYYGADPPWNELRAFDAVVLEPGHIPLAPGEHIAPALPIAYVSVGEIDPGRGYLKDLPAAWRLGTNPAWGGVVVDQSSPDWPEWYLARVIAPLWDSGYRAFFLDTLDSYQRVAKTEAARAAQEAGLIRVVRAIRARYPEAKLVFNRGFEILPAVHDAVWAVAAESLFRGWDPAAKRYREVSREDREWLAAQLARVRDQYHLPAIVIDYVPPQARNEARETARRIEAAGFVPWVANPELDMLGVGAIEVMPRQILMVYDANGRDIDFHPILDFASLPLNYLGFVPVYVRADQPLPAHRLAGRYAGVVTWFTSDASARDPAFAAWLKRAMDEGLKIAMFGHFGVPRERIADLFDLPNAPAGGGFARVSLAATAGTVGFEREPVPDRGNFFPLEAKGGTPVVRLRDESGRTMDAAALTPWGGYVLDPYAVSHAQIGNGVHHWTVQPIPFLRQALALPDMPVPDVTTENGRRLMIVHMDGDGFANRAELPGSPFAAEVMLREVFARYRIPTTVSVIEGETGPQGLFPDQSSRLEAIARKIFALPHIEPASHSYSHPFNWQDADSDRGGEGRALSIPGYRFEVAREIDGSIAYMEQRLLPQGKRVRMFLWTGECNPVEQHLARAAAAGVLNMNGGDTLVTRAQPSLALVAPLGLARGSHFQVYAPNQNENLYTGNWTGPYYGFERVIETFELTDAPYRLKPINVYFHTYSAAKRASLLALRKVLDWALAQPVRNVYASEYAASVLDFNRMVIARGTDGWRIHGGKTLRTVRVPKSMGFPDAGSSAGVAGHADYRDVRYVSLAAADAMLRFVPVPPRGPFLVDANARLLSMQQGDGILTLELAGPLPLELSLANAGSCDVRANKRPLRGGAAGELVRYKISHHARATVTVRCGV